MTQHIVKTISVEKVTHDVLRIKTKKPEEYNFTPGQATEISINKNSWMDEKRPFTFTSLPEDDYLEFTIKTYPAHHSVTNELLQLKENDELIVHDVFGAIHFQGEGVFIAGGAGVTPFISIFRYLNSKNEIGNNKLIFANKTKADIILEDEFQSSLGNNFINILSDEKVKGYANGQISTEFIKSNIDEMTRLFYICGPPPMMLAIEKQLTELKIEKNSVIKEAF